MCFKCEFWIKYITGHGTFCSQSFIPRRTFNIGLHERGMPSLSEGRCPRSGRRGFGDYLGTHKILATPQSRLRSTAPLKQGRLCVLILVGLVSGGALFLFEEPPAGAAVEDANLILLSEWVHARSQLHGLDIWAETRGQNTRFQHVAEGEGGKKPELSAPAFKLLVSQPALFPVVITMQESSEFQSTWKPAMAPMSRSLK